jgi:hypothetical protein
MLGENNSIFTQHRQVRVSHTRQASCVPPRRNAARHTSFQQASSPDIRIWRTKKPPASPPASHQHKQRHESSGAELAARRLRHGPNRNSLSRRPPARYRRIHSQLGRNSSRARRFTCKTPPHSSCVRVASGRILSGLATLRSHNSSSLRGARSISDIPIPSAGPQWRSQPCRVGFARIRDFVLFSPPPSPPPKTRPISDANAGACSRSFCIPSRVACQHATLSHPPRSTA